MVSLIVNGESRKLDIEPSTPLLWALRDALVLTGTKYGCGIALCGACTVLVEGQPARACVTPVSSVAGKRITTIEGLSRTGGHAVQRAWVAEDVPQCGFCQSGQILSAVALLERNRDPPDADINAVMSGVLCRCGTYQRIRRAIRVAAADKAAAERS
jgi:aerobic-type carbon monoxide dehydrogenase small subunit (CoxS/CutS family)